MASCNCKVGSCRVCDSDCKRCGCACDGTDPEVAKKRKRGKPPLHLRSDSARQAKKKAKEDIKKASKEPQVEKDPVLRPVKDVWKAFELQQSFYAKLPSVVDRTTNKNLKEDNHRGWSILFTSFCAACDSLARIMFEADPDLLLDHFARKRLSMIDENKELNKLKNVLKDIAKAAPRASIQGRVVRAAMAKGLSRASLDNLNEKDPSFSLVGSSLNKGFWDFKALVQGAILKKTSSARERFIKDHVETAVKFILCQENISTLSWGHRTIQLSATESVQLPALVRRKTPKVLYASYCENIPLDQQIGRTSFHEIVKILAPAGDRLLTAVDYVTGVLVNDQFDILQDILERFAKSEDILKTLTWYSTLSRNFLKCQYDNHACMEHDDISTHGIRYGLALHYDGPLKEGRCSACDFVNNVLKLVRDQIEPWSANTPQDVVDDAKRVMDDIENKLELYRGHRIRVISQQRAIDEMFQSMEDECRETKHNCTRAVLTIDWKMKFEAVSARETTQQHFGKRGISWHGCLLTFFRYIEDESMEDGDDEDDVDEVGDAERVNVYVDQILEGTNKQNAMAVLSMIEAAIEAIHHRFPFIKSISLQSDNAACYQSNDLMILLGFLNTRLPIPIERFIHTETQDGKGLIDAHFARGTAHVQQYMRNSSPNRVRSIATPRGLARALAWNGGIQNSIVQLIEVNQDRLGKLEACIEETKKKSSEYIPRVNELRYETIPKCAAGSLVSLENMESMTSSFILRGIAYSGVSNGATFKVSWTTFDHLPGKDDEGMEAIDQQVDPSEDEVQQDGKEIMVVGEDESEEENWGAQNATQSTYEIGDIDKGASMFTGVWIKKASHFTCILGPRDRNRKKRTAKAATGPEVERRDICAFAARAALDLLDSHSTMVRDGSQPMPEYEKAKTAVSRKIERKNGWARRPQHGKLYGKAYIDQYAEEVTKMFNDGVVDQSKRMNPAMMRERLKDKYPGRFSIPGENEIRVLVSKLIGEGKSKKNKKEKVAKVKVSEEGTRFLTELCQNNDGIPPRDALQHYRKAFPACKADDSTVKTKFSQIRQKLKVLAKQQHIG